MNAKIEKQFAYLLHSRAYRDSSLLVDFLTRDFGLVKAVARGIRKSKSSNRGLLQPFIPLQVSLVGKNELKTLRSVDAMGGTSRLYGHHLYAGFYINELLEKLCRKFGIDERLFELYKEVLADLKAQSTLEPVLRNFELDMLDILGFGINFDANAETGEPVNTEESYIFQVENGFIQTTNQHLIATGGVYSGVILRQIGNRNFSTLESRQTAKKLLREVLGYYTDGVPLRSRQLFSNLSLHQ